MPFFERGDVRIHYQEAGSGFPLFIIHGGGLDSSVSFPRGPFDAMETFRSEYRCITMDLRNSNRGLSTGPLEPERPWDMYTDDQLQLLEHLGVQKFFVMGFCIGNPLIWNLLQRVPERVVAAVSAQPSAVTAGNPDVFYTRAMANWGPTLRARRPDISMEQIEKFLRHLYKNADFVITASREFVRNCRTPLLVLPDNTDSHPYSIAMEMAHLAPNAEVSLFPWKDNKETIDLAVRHIRTFLQANQPTAATRNCEEPVLSAADRLEIEDLIARYNVSEDIGDIDSWVSTFTRDGSFKGERHGTYITGHHGLRQFAIERRRRPGVDRYVHWTSNVIISATDEGARAKSYVMTIECAPQGGFRIRGLAIKTDELRREDGRWRFKSRVNTPWQQGEAGGSLTDVQA
jgi:pimeloyl-ACP methyl ester carboxylesterase